jgi:hypothetical protein
MESLDLVKMNFRRLIMDREAIHIDSDTPIELIEAMEFLSSEFDNFRSLLLSVRFNRFPKNYHSLFFPYNDFTRDRGFIVSNDFVQLKWERSVLLKRIEELEKAKFNPLNWIRIIIEFLMRIPYKTIESMGFNPNEFIKTPIGQALAVILVVAFLIFAGFSVEQISAIFKQ